MAAFRTSRSLSNACAIASPLAATSATLTARCRQILPHPRTRHDRSSPALSDRAAAHTCFRRRVRASSSDLVRTTAMSFGGGPYQILAGERPVPIAGLARPSEQTRFAADDPGPS